ncbi:hypothetical protein Tco_0489951 [Tanacetum coccineum]
MMTGASSMDKCFEQIFGLHADMNSLAIDSGNLKKVGLTWLSIRVRVGLVMLEADVELKDTIVVVDSDSDIEVAYDETAQLMASGGANDASLYEDEDHDIYYTYDIKGLMKQKLAFCDMLDIKLREHSTR